MRVGSVPQLHPLDSNAALSVSLSSQRRVLLPEVVSDRSIVLGGHLERLEGQSSLGLLGNLAVGLPLGENGLVVGRGREDRDSSVVLSSSSKKGDSSDVDLLDGSGEGAVGSGDGGLEGVEVADDEGDGGDFVGGEISEIGSDVSGEDTWRR